MIFRFITSSSKALVLVPKMREKLGLDMLAGIVGSVIIWEPPLSVYVLNGY